MHFDLCQKACTEDQLNKAFLSWLILFALRQGASEALGPPKGQVHSKGHSS